MSNTSPTLEDVEQSLEKTVNEASKGQFKLHSFRGYCLIFNRFLQRLNERPGDAKDARRIFELLSQHSAVFEEVWKRPADTTSTTATVNEDLYEQLECASKFLLRLQNRRDIDQVGRLILRYLSKTLLRPLADKVQEAARARQRYIYSPLKYDLANEVRQIRTLCLLSKPGETLRCRIEHTNLDSARFKALSYEWGSCEKLYWIEVVDADAAPHGILPLTNNLHSALCDLRDTCASSEDEDQIYWIDQICVNQEDLTECSRQVNMMEKIYTVASRVVSYLGPEDVYDEIGFEVLDMVHAQYKHLYYSPILYGNLNKMNIEYADYRRVPPELRFTGKVSDTAWKAMNELTCGPWTRRIWMVQEASFHVK